MTDLIKKAIEEKVEDYGRDFEVGNLKIIKRFRDRYLRVSGWILDGKNGAEIESFLKLSLQQAFREGRREAIEEIAKDFKDEPIYSNATQQSIEAYFETKLSDLKKEI